MSENENSDQQLIVDIEETLTKYVTDPNHEVRRDFPRLLLRLLKEQPLEETLAHIHVYISAILVASEDQLPVVRTSLVEYIPLIFQFCHEHACPDLGNYLCDRLLQIVLQYLQDEDVEVRRDAYSILHRMLIGECLINKKQIEEQVCPTILSLTKKSFPDTQMEFALKAIVVIGRIVPILGSEKTEEIILDHFIELCSCEVINIRKACATIFPIMCHVLGMNITETKLLDIFSQLCDDIFWGVRKACAETIPLISLVVSKECRRNRLAPIVLNLIEDISKWVATSSYKILGEFISTFAEPCITGLAYTSSRELRIINPTDPDFTELSDQNLLNNYVYYVNKFTESGLKSSQQQQSLESDKVPTTPSSLLPTTIGNENNGIVTNSISITTLTPNEIAQIIIENKEKLIKQINSECCTAISNSRLKFYTIDCDFNSGGTAGDRGLSEQQQQQQHHQDYSNDIDIDDDIDDINDIENSVNNLTPLAEGTKCDFSRSVQDSYESSPRKLSRASLAIEEDNDAVGTAAATEDADNQITNFPMLPSSPSAPEYVFKYSKADSRRAGGYSNRLTRLVGHDSSLDDLSSIIREAIGEGKKRNQNDKITNLSMLPPPSLSLEQPQQQQQQQSLNTCCILMDRDEPPFWKGTKLEATNSNVSQNLNNKTKEQKQKDIRDFHKITNLTVDANSNTTTATAFASGSLVGNPSSSSPSPSIEDHSSNNNEIKSETETTQNSTNNNYNDNSSSSSNDDSNNDDDFNSYKYWYIKPDSVSISDDVVMRLNETQEYTTSSLASNRHDSNNEDIYRMIDENNQQQQQCYTTSNDESCFDKFCNLIKKNNEIKQLKENLLKDNDEIIPSRNFEQQQIVPSNILRNYVNASLRLNEEEIKLNCAYTFPAVVLTIGKENWNLIKPVMQYFCDELDWKVRKTIASSIDMLANILGKEITTRDLVPIYLEFFKDLDEVKIEAIKKFANFLTVVDLSRHDEILLNIGVCLRVDSTMNWRIKEDLAKQIFSLIEMYKEINKQENLLYLTSLTGLFLEDKISCVREIAVDALASIVKISSQTHREAIVKIFLIEEFALSDNWRKRQTFLNVLHKLITYNDQSLIDLFRLVFEHVENLSHDVIPNIRLLVAKTLVQLITVDRNILESKIPEDVIILETIKRLRTDKDRDVREISRSVSIGEVEEEEEEEIENRDDGDDNASHRNEEEDKQLDVTQEAEGDENWLGIQISSPSKEDDKQEKENSTSSSDMEKQVIAYISFLNSMEFKDKQDEAEESWDHETSFYVNELRGEVMTTTTTITTAPATSAAATVPSTTVTVSQEPSNEMNT